jgi:hypothetical protein
MLCPQPKRECDVSKGFTAGDVSDLNKCVRAALGKT